MLKATSLARVGGFLKSQSTRVPSKLRLDHRYAYGISRGLASVRIHPTSGRPLISVPQASASDEPGDKDEEEKDDAPVALQRGALLVTEAINGIKTFWVNADQSSRLLLVMLIPLLWFTSEASFFKAALSNIGGGIQSFLAPVNAWFQDTIFRSASYRLLQVFTLPTTGKLWAVLGIGAICTFLGAAIYRIASGSDWGDAIGKTYFTLNNVPGMDCTSDDTPRGTLVLNLIHILSLFTFAILVGILTDDISEAVEKVTTGNFPVPERDHTVLMGWNTQTIPILNQILQLQQRDPKGTFSLPILILAEKEKEDMDAELLDEFGPTVLGKTILTRQGRLSSKDDMFRVAAGQARTVMFLHGEDGAAADDDDAEEEEEEVGLQVDGKTKLLASLANLKALGINETANQNLIFQARVSPEESWEQDPICKYMLESLDSGDRKYRTTLVYDMKSLTDVMAQCASQPGLAAVFRTLFERSGAADDVSHMIGKFPSLVGKTFGEARRHFDGSVILCGILPQDQSSSGLNPPDDYVIQETDRVFYLSTKQESVKLRREPTPLPEVPARVLNRARPHAPGQKYVIVAHMDDPSQLIDSLVESIEQQEMSSPSTITVLTPYPLPEEPKGNRKVRVKYLSGELTDPELFLEAGVETADSVIFQLIGDAYTVPEKDAQTLHTILQIHGILDASNVQREKPLGIVCNIHDPEMIEVIDAMVHDVPNKHLCVDYIEPTKLLGGILTQIASEPDLRDVFEDLFDADGQEIYVKPLSHYGLSAEGQSIKWDVLQEVTRTDGDLLCGYVTKDEEVYLAIPTDVSVTLEEGDRLIVLAEDMYSSKK